MFDIFSAVAYVRSICVWSFVCCLYFFGSRIFGVAQRPQREGFALTLNSETRNPETPNPETLNRNH